MAAKKAKRQKRSGGAMMRMRAGAQNLAGTGKKKRKKGGAPITMQQMLVWGFGLAILVVLIWRLSL